MRKSLDHARLGHCLQRRARLAQLHAAALDAADTEALADELVDVDSARDDVAARFASLDRDAVLALHRLERLGRDQRQRSARLRFVEVVAIALEPAACMRAHGVDRLGQLAVLGCDVDALDPTVHRREPSSPSASARGLDRHDVAGCEVARDLGADRLAVDGVVSGRARLAASLAARGAAPAFADDREAAILEDAELADDAVAAAVHAVAAGAQPQAVALDT